jgi:hypothetical protein
MLEKADNIKSCYIGPEISPEEFIAEHFFLYIAKGKMLIRRKETTPYNPANIVSCGKIISRVTTRRKKIMSSKSSRHFR